MELISKQFLTKKAIFDLPLFSKKILKNPFRISLYIFSFIPFQN